jgi:hypothetical protein
MALAGYSALGETGKRTTPESPFDVTGRPRRAHFEGQALPKWADEHCSPCPWEFSPAQKL